MFNAEFFIIHFNDAYDIEEQNREPVGGASRFIYTVKHIKQHFKNVLTLFSGDLFSPSTLSNIYKGSQMILPFNHIGVDVACLGNHDFDFQLPQLQKLMSETKTPWLLSNVKNTQTGRLLADALEFYIKEINGFKIGFIGLAEQEWLGEIAAVPFDVMEYICYQETAEKLIKELRKECDFIIALTHMRVPNDIQLIEQVPKGYIDLVLGGHDHQWLRRKINETFYAKSGTNFRNLGLYRVGLSENKEWFEQFKQSFQYVELNDIFSFTLDNPITQRKIYIDALPINIVQSIPKDLEIEHFVQDCYKDYHQKTQKIIGFTKAPLETRFQIVRTTETGALNLFTDIVRVEFQTDVAIINSGTIRADDHIPDGPITYQTIDRIFAIPVKLPIITMRSGSTYIGEWYNMQKEGQGLFTWPDTSYYEGQFQNDKANGYGKLVHVDGDIYQGEWKDDVAQGKGTYTHAKGAYYSGEWKNDQQDGEGHEKWPDGTEYEGYFKEGKRHGKGKFKFIDGSIYEGDIEENDIHGYGQYIWKDGKVYKGQWNYNKMHGKGECIWPDGKSYTGEYADDKKNGYGVFKWTNGKTYEGQWKNGKQHGSGAIINSEGVRREGSWEDGKQL